MRGIVPWNIYWWNNSSCFGAPHDSYFRSTPINDDNPNHLTEKRVGVGSFGSKTIWLYYIFHDLCLVQQIMMCASAVLLLLKCLSGYNGQYCFVFERFRSFSNFADVWIQLNWIKRNKNILSKLFVKKITVLAVLGV